MTKIDIFSGFLGAGKTTLIKKLISDSYKGEKLVLIENEFGEIGIDGGFLKDSGIEITEMNSGCICCSLVGDFGEALKKVLAQFSPDRIIIEPSGVGKLSDVIRAVQNIGSDEIVLNAFATVVDAGKCKMYMKNFGEFFNDQVEHAGTVVMSHTDTVSPEKLKTAVELVKEKNPSAVIVTTPVAKLDGETLLEAIERKDTLRLAIEHLEHEQEEDECHEHHHDGECHEHHHEDECHEHHNEDECSCGCHDHEHHHHHADEVFVSWGTETTKKYTKEELENILDELCDEKEFGVILRAKGIVEGTDGNWIHFDYIPGEADVRNGSAGITGRLCVIGSKLNEENIIKAFGA